MQWQDHITIDQDTLDGKPVIKGTRMAVDFILELLAQGWPEVEILRNYPGLKPKYIRASLHYASEMMRSEKVYPLFVSS